MFRWWYDMRIWIADRFGCHQPGIPRRLATPEELKYIRRDLMLGAVGGVSGPMASVKAAQEAAEDDVKTDCDNDKFTHPQN